jgi:hypothetical protein
MEPAESQRLATVSVGKQSEVADLDEAGGQDMEQEAADELDRVELHDAAAVVVSGVPPSEAHLAVIEAEESSVGDGNLWRMAVRWELRSLISFCIFQLRFADVARFPILYQSSEI